MGIRRDLAPDAAATRRVHTASFPSDGEARLVEALRASARLSVSLVAEDSGQVIGHVAFSPVTVSGDGAGAGLGPVAVLPAFRRCGVAAALIIRRGLAACAESGHGFVVVLGEPAYCARSASWRRRVGNA